MSTTGNIHSISILIVDADEQNRNLLADTLDALGYNIIASASVKEAGNLLKHHKIDLVICDMFAPSRQGIDLMQKLKEKRPDIPVILMSGLIGLDIEDELMRLGADGILQKPCRIHRIEEVIATTLLRYDQTSLTLSPAQWRVLVIDDDPGLLSFMLEGMRVLGYDAAGVRDSDTAISEFEKRKFDLVISDYMLANTSGVDLIKRLNNIRTDIPFILVTGYPLAYTPSMAKADGINGYLVKPFRINQMEQAIVNALYPERNKNTN